jgi:hypothetical protein
MYVNVSIDPNDIAIIKLIKTNNENKAEQLS